MTGDVDLRPFAPVLARRWVVEDPARDHLRVDGTLVFVDISGFTAMSERLNRLGRVGAEEVTALLNETFNALLSVAYGCGGHLLKFGGDALLVQFDGDDHVARGVRAAWDMRATLRAAQPLTSSAGKVHLRMSVGVHTGPVDHVLVGAAHRELFVVGPVATETVRLEGSASAGQVMVSSAVARALAGRITTRLPRGGDGSGLLLQSPPAVHARPTPPAATDPTTAALLIPERLRRHLSAGDVRAEHRPAVVAFVKFSGVDALLAEEGPRAVADALDELVGAVTAAADHEEVCLLASDVDADGGKLILAAGVPTSHEHDGERMLRVLRAIVEAEPRLPVKVGAHHGLVYCGAIGPPYRLTYTIIGDTVNLAARVMAHASAGTVLATPAVLNRSHALFEVEEVPPFRAKGKRQPVAAYRVGAGRDLRRRPGRARFPLAGRDAELAALLQAADRAAQGSGCVVELIGPAGIGKSRLVDELHERRPDRPAVVVGCNRYEQTTPYHVVGQLLRAVLELDATASADDLERAVAERACELAPELPLLGDATGIRVPDTEGTRDLAPGFRSRRTVQATCDLLGAVLPAGTVIVVEDLYWVDPESWAVVIGLAAAVATREPWLLVVTTRNALALGARASVPVVALPVPPLGEDAGRALVFAAVDEGLVSLDAGLRVLERADGNPFFLQELLTAGAGDELELPSSVDALVQDQLDQLPVADRAILADASVLGAEVDVDMLADILGDDPSVIADRLGALHGFVDRVGPRTFRFRHALIHDGAYGRLPFHRRRTLHRWAAAAIEADAHRRHRADLLALHTFRAGDWDRARTHALRAAEQAAARFANLSAAEQYRRALASCRHLPALPHGELAAMWERLGDVLLLASAYDEAADAYRRAKALAPPADGARLCGKVGQLRERQGRYGQALWWYGRALTLDGGGTERPRLLVERAIVRARQGRAEEAAALAAAAAPLTADPCTAARVAYVQAWSAMLRGEDGRAHEQRSLELFTEAGDLVGQGLAWNIISMSAYYRGEWAEAARAYEEAAAMRRRVGDEVAAAVAAGNLGELYADQGRFEEAKGLLEECRTVCRAAGFRSSEHFAAMTLARLASRTGDYATAHAELVRAREELAAMSMAVLEFDAARHLAELHLFRGDHVRALFAIDELETMSPGTPAMGTVAPRLRACVLLEQGAVGTARELALDLLRRIPDGARDYDSNLALVVVAVVLEEAGDQRAPALRARADEALARLGVVVPGELLTFGPTSPRTRAALAQGRPEVASTPG